MKVHNCIPLVLLLAVFVFVIVAASTINGSFKQFTLIAPAFAIPPDQGTVVKSTWVLPESTQNISDIESDFSGNAYFSESSSNKIVRLEPTTNMITEWEIPSSGNSSAQPTGIALDPSTGSIYFTESGTNKIGRLEPTTKEVTEWSLPNGSSNMTLDEVRIDSGSGNLYLIDDSGYVVTRLEPTTNTFTEWTLPISSSNISDITFGFDAIYFTESGTNKIGRLEPTTNMITEWEIPSSGNSSAQPTGIALDPSTGSIYFTESGTNKIGRLNPITNLINNWDIEAKPLAINVTPGGSVYYIDDLGRIGRLG
jgi:virginiamycin B lyase